MRRKIKHNTILHIAILTALVLIIIVGTAKSTFASCIDNDACEAISCTDCCKEGYTEYYRCIGNERQRLWQYSDCRREWKAIETCSYGCADGYCLCAAALAEVSPSTPSDRFEEETVYTTIKVQNLGSQGAYFDLEVYLCEATKSCTCSSSCTGSCGSCYDYCDCDAFVKNCREMRCDDTHIYVPGKGTRYVKCSRSVKNAGDYRVKVVYSSDSYRTKRTVYSGIFKVLGECRAGAEGDYRCFGRYMQQKYVDENCDVRWKIVEYCPYGCESGACVQPTVLPKLGEPEIFMRTQYELERCKLSSFTFTVRNKGETDTFDIKAGGDSADWIDVVPSATIEKGETKVITAYVSVPCDARAGEHEFKITASSKTSDLRTSTIKIPEERGLFTKNLTNDLIIIAVIIIVFVLAIVVYKGGLGEIKFRARKREPAAEEFKAPATTSFTSKIFKKTLASVFSVI